jgi:integrase/recombinase XerD
MPNKTVHAFPLDPAPSIQSRRDINPSVVEFLNAMWLEQGLATNTLAAYRNDLASFDIWLHTHNRDGSSLCQSLAYAHKAIFTEQDPP